jgi:hypothetical protein
VFVQHTNLYYFPQLLGRGTFHPEDGLDSYIFLKLLTTIEEGEVDDGEPHEQVIGQHRDAAVPNFEVADLLEVLKRDASSQDFHIAGI